MWISYTVHVELIGTKAWREYCITTSQTLIYQNDDRMHQYIAQPLRSGEVVSQPLRRLMIKQRNGSISHKESNLLMKI